LTKDDRPNETTILRFRRLLEKRGIGAQMLETIHARLSERRLPFKADTRVETRHIAAPSSTENKTGGRDPELPSTKKPRQTHFGMRMYHLR